MRGQFPQSGESVHTPDWSAGMSPASSPGSLLPKYRRLTRPFPSESVGFNSIRTLSHTSRGLRDAPQTSTFGEGGGGLGWECAFGSAEIVTEPSPAPPPEHCRYYSGTLKLSLVKGLKAFIMTFTNQSNTQDSELLIILKGLRPGTLQG